MQLSDRQHACVGILIWGLTSFWFFHQFQNGLVSWLSLHFGSIFSLAYIFITDYVKYKDYYTGEISLQKMLTMAN
ncbi:MAG: hypothetical protein Q8Q95_01185 [bacterium]|nr:hypothetical protein [bacterium]